MKFFKISLVVYFYVGHPPLCHFFHPSVYLVYRISGTIYHVIIIFGTHVYLQANLLLVVVVLVLVLLLKL